MTLAEVITNLERTIKTKREYLASLRADMQFYGTMAHDVATEAFLDININELQRILDDLKKVQP
jgi:hypothetical protein